MRVHRRTAKWCGVVLLLTVFMLTPKGQGVSTPGHPLEGMTPQDFALFRLGLDDFLEFETAEEGLGPAFNGASCAVCHNVPAVGGTGIILETRAGYREADGSFRGLDEAGETLVQLFSVPTHGCQPVMPHDVTVIARRAPIPLFGAGLVEAIADATLVSLEDPLDANFDGISGRAARVIDVATGEERIGRFGWKAQHATLLAFGADAYRNEMGITNDLFPTELAHGVDAERMRLCDPMPDPEDAIEPATMRRGIDNFESFMKFLAPVARGPIDASAAAGARVFSAIGCAACHVPVLATAPDSHPLFDRREVALFSDLLLHDIGTGDGIVQASATEHEIRTPALWGLRLRRPLLHDGSAVTIEEAIERHGNEASTSQRGFKALGEIDRAQLLDSLRSL
ncbi:MAG: di-heme oxidoredictase family protein [Vicinamibacterales bacterium]